MRTLFLLFLLPNLIFASGIYPSPLPKPELSIINLNTEKCSFSCLKDYYKEGHFFSFLANINKDNSNEEMIQKMNALLLAYEIKDIPFLATYEKPTFNIALFFPKKAIGRYSTMSANAILAYLLYQKSDFNFEVFDSKSENIEDLTNTIELIKQKGYHQAIGILTQDGANNLNSLQPQIEIFIPSVHSSQIKDALASNIIWGGISYDEQIEKLSDLGIKSKAVSFYDMGTIGTQMNESVRKYNEEVAYSHGFNLQEISEFPKEFKNIKPFLQKSKIFLNTPITNSSIILSQITYNSIKHNGIYSTQINYNPSLLLITQEADRKNMFIANSILPLNPSFIDQASLFNVDIQYDWINYTTTYGVEYFYKKSVNGERFFSEKIKNHQVQYKINIITPKQNRFLPL